jgi:hypothetical protein
MFFYGLYTHLLKFFRSQEPFGAGLGLRQRGARDGTGDAKIYPGQMVDRVSSGLDQWIGLREILQ